jgi:DNA transformation protein
MDDDRSELVDHVIDLLRPWALVGARHMFGGWGLYRGRVMFGLVAEESLYLKADDDNRGDYTARRMEPFRYEHGGKSVTMSYYAVPADVTQSADALAAWAEKAHQAALREASRDRRGHARVRK